MPAPEPLRFAPRVDALFAGIMAVVVGITLAVVVAAMLGEGDGSWWVMLAALGPLALVLGVVFPIRYTFQRDAFEAKQGAIATIRAPYARMLSVRRKRQIMNSPEAIAMARDMLEITYEAGTASRWKKHLRVAPKDEASFLAELQRRAPHLEVEGLEDVLAEAAKLPVSEPPAALKPAIEIEPPVEAPPFTRAARRARG